jgi:hypothetical protein
MAGLAQADFTPVNLDPNSFTQDMVVEKTGPAPLIPGGASTASMDGGSANNGDTWNEQGYFPHQPGVGLPPAGTVITSLSHANKQFQMPPSYTANNAVMLDATSFSAKYTITPTTPRALAALSFLTSGGNGGCIFQWTVHHQDGSTQTGQLPSADWFNVADPVIIANGRVNAQGFDLDNFNSNNPRLYAKDATLNNTTSPVVSIDLQYVSSAGGAHTCIMGVSGADTAGGAFTPVPFTGYNADIVVEATYPQRWDYLATAGTPVNPATTASMDGGTANTGASWFEQTYYAPSNTFGLPAAGSTFAAQDGADHQFKMPVSYTTGNNALFLDPANPNGAITLATPAAYSALSLLTSSGGGSGAITVVVNHQDGTTETNNITSPDWYNNNNRAVNSNGRINVQNGVFDSLNSGNPRLYFVDFTLNNSVSPVTSLDLTYTSTGARAAVFALSGAAGAVKPVITVQPRGTTVSPTATASFDVTASGTAPLSFLWQKGTNGVYINLSNGGSISGQGTTNLLVNNAAMSDAADYRVIVSNAAGSATSAVATLTVLSPLTAVTLPTDSIRAYQPNGGSSPGAEGVEHAIDANTSKYLNFGNGVTPLTVPVGFIVTPSMGRTIVTGLRFYTANDAPERDPANYIIEGSNDGGATYTLISSNSLVLPDGRNNGGQALNFSQFLTQVLFPNDKGFSTYRIYCTRIKGNANLMQIGEVEILGVADTSGFPTVTQQPVDATAYVGTSAQFTVTGSGTPAPVFFWQKGGTILTDGPNVTGSRTATLTLNNLAFEDAGDYSVIVSNSVGTAPSATAKLTVVSTLTDVTQPTDVSSCFGDASDRYGDATNSLNAIDNSMVIWQNGGSGFSAPAGFPPFAGPVGIIVTPAVGSTLVTGIRVYASTGNTERDPADFTVYGSNDGGASFTQVASGALSLPLARNTSSSPIDPLQASLAEVLFSNSAAYTTYKVSFTHTRNDNAASLLQIGDLELLGVPAVTLGSSVQPNGQLKLEWTQGILLEAPTVTGPWTTNSAPSPLLVTPTGQQHYYKLQLP